jgi:hypothetical protein
MFVQESSETVPGTSRCAKRFLLAQHNDRRSDMKKLSCVLAALATFAVAAPTVASAQGFSFRIGGDPDYYYRDRDYYRGPRAEFYGHRGWYRDGDRTVVIRRHHYWDD